MPVSAFLSGRFQSTLPARGATEVQCMRMRYLEDFNPRSPHGERPSRPASFSPCIDISIHAPRTGSDPPVRASLSAYPIFQSTLPARGATTISVDGVIFRLFQSTLPARGATFRKFFSVYADAFQSTLPARGATMLAYIERKIYCISIHAPRTGSDFLSELRFSSHTHFNPRSPHGERHKRF